MNAKQYREQRDELLKLLRRVLEVPIDGGSMPTEPELVKKILDQKLAVEKSVATSGLYLKLMGEVRRKEKKLWAGSVVEAA